MQSIPESTLVQLCKVCVKYPQFRGIRCYRCNMWKRLNKSGVFNAPIWWGGMNGKRVATWKRKRTGNQRLYHRVEWPKMYEILRIRKELIEGGDDPGVLNYFPGRAAKYTSNKWKERVRKVVYAQEDFLRRKLNEQAEPGTA